MKKILISCLLITTCTAAMAQSDSVPVRKLPAVRTTTPIKIDGKLDDIAWKTAPVANNFIEWRPGSGKPENYANRTEVYVLYDDDAIYVSGFCHEATNDSISKELV